MNTSAEPKGEKYRFISNYLWLLAFPMVIGVGAILIQFQLIYRTIQEQKLQAVNRVVMLAEREVLGHFEETIRLIVGSERPHAEGRSSDEQGHFMQIWREQSQLNPLIDKIFFAGSAGQWFSSGMPADHRFSPESRPWFKAAVLRPNVPVWTLPYDDAFSSEKTITVSYAIKDPMDTRSSRVVGIDVKLHEWSAKIAEATTGDNGLRHMLIDRVSGTILLHSNPANVGTKLKQGWLPLLIGQSGSFYTQEAVVAGGKGEGAYVAYEALGNSANWLAVTIQLQRDTFLQQQMVLILVTLIFAACLFIILALLFRHRLAGVIDSLTLMVRQLRLSPDRHSLALPSIPGFHELNSEMSLVSEHLQDSAKLATQDGLTGLYNRRHLNERLAKLQEQQTSVVLALIDLDNFKSINDTFGHAVGDTVLRRVAALGLESLGEEATLFRYGGEELAVVFEQIAMKEAERQLERWRVNVCKAQWRENTLKVTFSGGVGDNEGRTMEASLAAVDQALYRAKDDGKNRIYRAKSE